MVPISQGFSPELYHVRGRLGRFFQSISYIGIAQAIARACSAEIIDPMALSF